MVYVCVWVRMYVSVMRDSTHMPSKSVVPTTSLSLPHHYSPYGPKGSATTKIRLISYNGPCRIFSYDYVYKRTISTIMQDINDTGAKGQNWSIAQNATKHQCHTHPSIARRRHVSKSDSNHKTRLTHLRDAWEDAEIKKKRGAHLWVTWRYLSDSATRQTRPNTHNMVRMATHETNETADCSNEGDISGTRNSSRWRWCCWSDCVDGNVPLMAS